MVHNINPLDLTNVKTYPIKNRKNIVHIHQFAKIPDDKNSCKNCTTMMPFCLKANDFRNVVNSIVNAHKMKKPVIFAIGGHVIKTGVSPLIIDLMKRNIVTAIAMNGSTSIHDFEIALIGETSEDVGTALEDGTFGMATETGLFMNEAINEGAKKDIGLGDALGRKLLEMNAPHINFSILAMGTSLNIPITVHVAIGTDIIHQHPHADGASIGKTSYFDFKLFSALISQLNDGGVFLNIGSAVILPEVFLKALSVSRNLGYPVKNFVAANFDMIMHYRPNQNVTIRPTISGGHGYNIIGHHEIMIPFLYSAIRENLS